MAITLRPVTDDEYPEYKRVEGAAFGEIVDAERIAVDRRVTDLDRTIAAFDGARQIGATASFAFDMTVPGSGSVPVAGITGVAVSPTHRRRGVLRSMMTHQLDDVAGRGEVAAVLNASEATIYGRFGYGLAELFQSYRLDGRRSRLRVEPAARPALRLLSQQEALDHVGPPYAAWASTRPGALTRSPAWWQVVLGRMRLWVGGGDLFVVLAPPSAGGPDEPADPGGYAIYELTHTGNGGWMRLTVREVVAARPDTELALWHYLLGVDLVEQIDVIGRPLDCRLRWCLSDQRDLSVYRVHDFLWIRLLDVEAALSARRYPVDDEVVVDVTDHMRPATSGRYLVRGGRDGAECSRTDQAPDVALGIEDLGAAFLGQTRLADLAHAGQVEECRDAGLRRADRFFRWPVAPYCGTNF